MKSNKVTIRQLRNGKYQVEYRHPMTAKRIRKRFDNYKEAKAYELDAQKIFDKGKKEHLQTLTIKELMELHFDRVPDSKADSRRVAYLSFMERFGEVELGNLSTVELKSWLSDLRAERDYAEITMAHITGSLNHFFNYLIDEGLIAKSPLSSYRIDRAAPPKRPRVFFTEEELKLILEKAKEFSPAFLYPFFMGLIHTGARRAEMVDLQWKDVDFASNVIRIKDAKGGAIRPIKMSPPLRRLLERHPRVSKYVFTNPEGEMVGRSQLHRHIVSFKACYPFQRDWGCHAFRHSFAYNFLKKGGQMYELMAVLGHKSIVLTVNLYGRIRAEDVEDPSPYDIE